MSFVEQYNDSHASVITLTNSQEGNVLNMGSMDELFSAFASSIKDKDVRVILLRSKDPAFCMGMDLKMLQSLENKKDQAEQAVNQYVQLLFSIYASPKPVICLLRGEVKAGGIGLVSACDIVLASLDASFEFSEVFFGLIPANVLPFVYSLRLSPQKARYLVLTAKKILALEAYKLNLVDELFSAEDFEKGVKSVVKNLFRASPGAIAEAKKFTHSIFGEKLERSAELAKKALLGLIHSPDVIKAIRSFNEGNLPEWFAKFKPEKPL